MTNIRCPVCGGAAHDATPVGGHRGPQPDDVAVCLHCAAVLVYDGDLRLRLPRGPERAELYGDAGIAKVRQAVRSRIKAGNLG
jgi:hypothetical protein